MREATAALKVANEKAGKELEVKKKEGLEFRLRVYREMGGSEREVREAGKRHLRRMGGGEGEVEGWAGGMGLGNEGRKGDGDVEMRDVDADVGVGGKDTEEV